MNIPNAFALMSCVLGCIYVHNNRHIRKAPKNVWKQQTKWNYNCLAKSDRSDPSGFLLKHTGIPFGAGALWLNCA